MINENSQNRTERKEKTIELLVGYKDYCYSFQIEGEDKKSSKNGVWTNDWSMSSFYNHGLKMAKFLKKRGATGYTINNGNFYDVVYDIPKEEAEAWARMRADDPFWSRGDPPAHDEKVPCRPLLPEQLESFRKGLEEQLKSEGEIKEIDFSRGKEKSQDLVPYVIANQYAQLLMGQKYSENIEEDHQIKTRKLFEAMLTGHMDLSPPKGGQDGRKS
jgi:hypothetical protein